MTKAQHTPGQPWWWQSFGGSLNLFSSPGARVVLSAPHRSRIETRDPETGMLREVRADDEVARLIAEAPAMLDALQDFVGALNDGDSVAFQRAETAARAILSRIGGEK